MVKCVFVLMVDDVLWEILFVSVYPIVVGCA